MVLPQRCGWNEIPGCNWQLTVKFHWKKWAICLKKLRRKNCSFLETVLACRAVDYKNECYLNLQNRE